MTQHELAEMVRTGERNIADWQAGHTTLWTEFNKVQGELACVQVERDKLAAVVRHLTDELRHARAVIVANESVKPGPLSVLEPSHGAAELTELESGSGPVSVGGTADGADPGEHVHHSRMGGGRRSPVLEVGGRAETAPDYPWFDTVHEIKP